MIPSVYLLWITIPWSCMSHAPLGHLCFACVVLDTLLPQIATSNAHIRVFPGLLCACHLFLPDLIVLWVDVRLFCFSMKLLLLFLFIISLIISVAGEYLCLTGCKKSFKSAQFLSIHDRTCKCLQQQTQAAPHCAYDQPICSPWSRPSAPSVSSPKNPPEPGQRSKDARKRTNSQGGNEQKRKWVAQEDRAGSSGVILNLVRSSCIKLRPVARFYSYPIYITRWTGCLMLCHLTMLIYRVVSPNLLIISSLIAFGLSSNTER